MEFFFILSGFFFSYTLDINQDIFAYIKKKLIRLWPVLAFYTLCLVCMDSWHMPAAQGNFYNRIYSLFLLNGIGITRGDTGVSWFVSALFFSSLFLFYLYKSCTAKTANLLLSIIVLFSYIILINTGTISSRYEGLYGILPLPLLRAVGGMGLGIFLFYTYSNFNRNNLVRQKNNNGKLIYGFIETFLLIFSIYLVTCAKWPNEMIVIISFLALLYVFLLNKGLLSNLLNNNFSVAIGKYSYSIFLTHILVIYLVVYSLDLNSPFIANHALLFIVLLCLTVIIVGVITYHFIEKPTNILFRKLGYYYYLVVLGAILIISSLSYIIYCLVSNSQSALPVI